MKDLGVRRDKRVVAYAYKIARTSLIFGRKINKRDEIDRFFRRVGISAELSNEENRASNVIIILIIGSYLN